MIDITIWGSRGSIPVSGAQFHRHGGATTSLEFTLVDANEDTPNNVLIDCGTGLTELGKDWGDRSPNALILQTHVHWDHIQGFPFFRPLFNPKGIFDLWAVPRDGIFFQQVLSQQMSRPAFPVGLDILPSQLTFTDLMEEGETQVGELNIQWKEMWHPSGCTAYRLQYRDACVVFSGDVELQQDEGCRQRLTDLARDADVLIMDAQYFPEEYPQRLGFGHSTPVDAVNLAIEAGVKHLILTHHDPNHDDQRLDEKLALARQVADGRLQIDNAHERMRIRTPQRQHDLASAS